MESSTPTYNKTIDVLKCFLCFGIVLYHTNFSPSVLTEKVAFFDEWRHIFIYTVLDVCVPLFFVISGYLYFNRVNQLTYSLYKAKTISRVRTLLLPYLIANIIFLLLRIIVNPDLDLSFLNILNGITGYNGFPANYPLWFIRDLFIVCVLSPLFFFAAKRLPYVVLIVLLVCWFTNIWFDSFPQIASVRSFLFFYIGALLAIKRPQLRLTMLNKVVIGGGGILLV